MAEVTILAGLPGSGKTHYREEHMPQMSGIDMADIYQEHQERFPDFHVPWEILHQKMHRQLIQILRQEGEVWVEGIFDEGSPSLNALVEVIRAEGATAEVIRMDANLEECFARVAEDFESGNVSAQKTRKRNEILRSMAKKKGAVSVSGDRC